MIYEKQIEKFDELKDFKILKNCLNLFQFNLFVSFPHLDGMQKLQGSSGNFLILSHFRF